MNCVLPGDAMASTEPAVDLMHRYMEALVNGDQKTMGELLSDEVSHNLSRSGIEVDISSRQDVLDAARLAGPVDVKFHDIFSSGDRVAGRYSYSISGDEVAGARPGSAAQVTGIVIARIEAGKIREVWHEQDVLGMLLAFGM